MYYNEYLKSAFRHLSTCKQLINDIQSAQGTQADRNHWLCEVYYLSGYIVECMLSYVLFYGYRDHVNKHQLYCGEFLTHNLSSKVHHVRNVAGRPLNGVILISTTHQKRSVNALFSKWNVDSRYEPTKIVNHDDLITYLQSIEQAKNQILNMYPVV